MFLYDVIISLYSGKDDDIRKCYRDSILWKECKLCIKSCYEQYRYRTPDFLKTEFKEDPATVLIYEWWRHNESDSDVIMQTMEVAARCRQREMMTRQRKRDMKSSFYIVQIIPLYLFIYVPSLLNIYWRENWPWNTKFYHGMSNPSTQVQHNIKFSSKNMYSCKLGLLYLALLYFQLSS